MQERPVARRSEALSMLDSLGLLRKVSSPEESLKKLSFPEDSLSKLAHGEDSVGREMLSKLSSADVSGGREKHRGVEVGVVLAEVGGLTPSEAVQHPAVWLPWIMADTPAARPMRRAALKAVIGRHYGVGMMSVADRAAFAAFVLVLESFNEVHLRAGSSEASPGELAVIEAITIQMHALRVGALWSQEQKVNFLRKMELREYIGPFVDHIASLGAPSRRGSWGGEAKDGNEDAVSAAGARKVRFWKNARAAAGARKEGGREIGRAHV